MRNVSANGIINIAIAMAGLDLNGKAYGKASKLNSTKLIVNTDKINPTINDPVSPIKIFGILTNSSRTLFLKLSENVVLYFLVIHGLQS